MYLRLPANVSPVRGQNVQHVQRLCLLDSSVVFMFVDRLICALEEYHGDLDITHDDIESRFRSRSLPEDKSPRMSILQNVRSHARSWESVSLGPGPSLGLNDFLNAHIRLVFLILATGSVVHVVVGLASFRHPLLLGLAGPCAVPHLSSPCFEHGFAINSSHQLPKNLLNLIIWWVHRPHDWLGYDF